MIEFWYCVYYFFRNCEKSTKKIFFRQKWPIFGHFWPEKWPENTENSKKWSKLAFRTRKSLKSWFKTVLTGYHPLNLIETAIFQNIWPIIPCFAISTYCGLHLSFLVIFQNPAATRQCTKFSKKTVFCCHFKVFFVGTLVSFWRRFGDILAV